MYWQKLFPKSDIQILLKQYDINSDDDVMIASIQSNLVTNLLMPTVKTMLISCIHSNRKYININDVIVAKKISHFNSVLPAKNSSSLLCLRHFKVVVNEHIHLLSTLLVKNNLIIPHMIKISNDMVIELQELIESYIRNFMEQFSLYCTEHSKKSNLNVYLYVLSSFVLNDSSFLTYDNGYKKW